MIGDIAKLDFHEDDTECPVVYSLAISTAICILYLWRGRFRSFRQGISKAASVNGRLVQFYSTG